MADENNGADKGGEGAGGDDAAKAAALAAAAGGDKKGANGDGADKGGDKGASDYDWRGAIAGEDKKLSKRLERFTDLTAFGKSYFEADARLNSGKLVSIPGEDATDEDRSAWAKARGIPEDPKKYEIKAKPPEGYEVTDTDKTRLADITAYLHKQGGIYADPAVVNAAHALYYREQETAVAWAEATATRHAELTEEALSKLWPGHEKERNKGFAKAAAVEFFGKEWDEIRNMQFADGSLLGDNLQFVQAFAKIGRLTMDDPMFLEAGRNGADPSKSLLDQKTAIMRLRDSNPKAYAEAAREGGKLDQINEALERHEQRAGASQH
jgi:hypothetical protein